MPIPFLRAGLLWTPADDICLHCSRPASGAARCGCGLDRDDLRPGHGVAEVFFSAHGRASS